MSQRYKHNNASAAFFCSTARNVSGKVAGKPIVEQMGLEFPYDWSNPDIPDEALILSVLKKGRFNDILRICIYYGTETVSGYVRLLDDLNYSSAVFDDHDGTIKRKAKERAIRILETIKEGEKSAHERIPGLPGDSVRKAPAARGGLFSSCSFKVMGVDGLRVAKAVVLGYRVRSRDLFDLMILVRRHGYKIASLLKDAVTFGENNDPEYYKSVLTGEIPLDKDDEGLVSVGVKVRMDEIYSFFTEEIRKYETKLAADMFTSHLVPPIKCQGIKTKLVKPY